MKRIVVVEDDIEQQEELVAYLMHTGFDACGASHGAALESMLEQFTPDIVLLDYGLPDVTGAELAARLRQRFGMRMGLIMVTARGHSQDRVTCRQAGADDYLVKPIVFEELLAVVTNLMQRLNPPESLTPDTPTPLQTSMWLLRTPLSQLHLPDGPVVHLTVPEVKILAALAESPEQIASNEALIRALGKLPDAYDPRALQATVSRLRRKLPKLADGSETLQSVRGHGYKLVQLLFVERHPPPEPRC